MLEGGQRVPALLYWKGRLQGGRQVRDTGNTPPLHYFQTFEGILLAYTYIDTRRVRPH